MKLWSRLAGLAAAERPSPRQPPPPYRREINPPPKPKAPAPSRPPKRDKPR